MAGQDKVNGDVRRNMSMGCESEAQAVVGLDQSLAGQVIPSSKKDESESQRGTQSLEQNPGRMGREDRFEAKPWEMIPWSGLH